MPPINATIFRLSVGTVQHFLRVVFVIFSFRTFSSLSSSFFPSVFRQIVQHCERLYISGVPHDDPEKSKRACWVVHGSSDTSQWIPANIGNNSLFFEKYEKDRQISRRRIPSILLFLMDRTHTHSFFGYRCARENVNIPQQVAQVGIGSLMRFVRILVNSRKRQWCQIRTRQNGFSCSFLFRLVPPNQFLVLPSSIRSHIADSRLHTHFTRDCGRF